MAESYEDKLAREADEWVNSDEGKRDRLEKRRTKKSRIGKTKKETEEPFNSPRWCGAWLRS